ncbi:MAG: cytochrome-c peroxidase, partial [Gammaproteobacteria bacterium]|nr:cytochrome-c peroxidase [Gammaproteobacteria bacterium]
MKLAFSTQHIQLFIITLSSLLILSCSSPQAPVIQNNAELTASEKLGKALFFDTRLSSPEGQSCASCHSPEHGFSQPIQSLATAEGATKGLFGNRNVPTIAYIGFTPKFHKEIEDGDTLFVGGFFLDGRESTLEDQATKPILNPVEMGIASEQALVKKIKDSGYEEAFNDLYGKDSLNNTKTAIQFISQAIAD